MNVVDQWWMQIQAIVVALHGNEAAARSGVSLALQWVAPIAATKTAKGRPGSWMWEARCCLIRGTGPTADAAMAALKTALEAEVRKQLATARARIDQLEGALSLRAVN
jgi:hypothetical protein